LVVVVVVVVIVGATTGLSAGLTGGTGTGFGTGVIGLVVVTTAPWAALVGAVVVFVVVAALVLAAAVVALAVIVPAVLLVRQVRPVVVVPAPVVVPTPVVVVAACLVVVAGVAAEDVADTDTFLRLFFRFTDAVDDGVVVEVVVEEDGRMDFAVVVAFKVVCVLLVLALVGSNNNTKPISI
jgi:hypothetical protein